MPFLGTTLFIDFVTRPAKIQTKWVCEEKPLFSETAGKYARVIEGFDFPCVAW